MYVLVYASLVFNRKGLFAGELVCARTGSWENGTPRVVDGSPFHPSSWWWRRLPFQWQPWLCPSWQSREVCLGRCQVRRRREHETQYIGVPYPELCLWRRLVAICYNVQVIKLTTSYSEFCNCSWVNSLYFALQAKSITERVCNKITTLVTRNFSGH